MISLEKIDLIFGEKIIFNKFDLAINQSEKICIKGRSGIGKTSLFNLIMGFQKPDSGSIAINKRILDRSSVRTIRSKMCWLPQNHELFNSEIVLNAILKPFGYSQNKSIKPSSEDINECFEALNLGTELLQSQFKELSGGEKQRVGLVICKLLNRPIVLLDEPTSALDKETIDEAIKFILNDNTTIISISHEDKWIASCDRVIEL